MILIKQLRFTTILLLIKRLHFINKNTSITIIASLRKCQYFCNYYVDYVSFSIFSKF